MFLSRHSTAHVTERCPGGTPPSYPAKHTQMVFGLGLAEYLAYHTKCSIQTSGGETGKRMSKKPLPAVS